jgi:hypothetical protein
MYLRGPLFDPTYIDIDIMPALSLIVQLVAADKASRQTVRSTKPFQIIFLTGVRSSKLWRRSANIRDSMSRKPPAMRYVFPETRPMRSLSGSLRSMRFSVHKLKTSLTNLLDMHRKKHSMRTQRPKLSPT